METYMAYMDRTDDDMLISRINDDNLETIWPVGFASLTSATNLTGGTMKTVGVIVANNPNTAYGKIKLITLPVLPTSSNWS